MSHGAESTWTAAIINCSECHSSSCIEPSLTISTWIRRICCCTQQTAPWHDVLQVSCCVLCVQGQRQLHVAFCLKLLEMCFKHAPTPANTAHASLVLDDAEAAIHRLKQLQDFARGMGDAAAGLDIKPFLIPYLPAQLLTIVTSQTTKQCDDDDEEAAGSKGLAAGLAEVHLAAVEELSMHTNTSNVQAVAELIHQLPQPTSLDSSAVSSIDVDCRELQLVDMSSSTVYTAAVCGLLLDLPDQDPHDQSETCQQVADYLPQLSAHHLTGLLLWAVLQQPHPLLPSGPQLPSQLPEELRLSLVQAGLELLRSQADRDGEIALDSRLEAEASKLSVLCTIQQSCQLTQQQQGMVEQALQAAASEDDISHEVAGIELCVAQLLCSGLPLQDLLLVTSALERHSQTATASMQNRTQAAEVATAVVQKLLSQALAVLAHDSSDSATQPVVANGHQNGLAEEEAANSAELLSLSTHHQASDCILGILESLQSTGDSEQAQQLAAKLRKSVWSTLQQHLLSPDHLSDSCRLQPAQLQLLELVLGLSTAQSTTSVASASPEKVNRPLAIHWEGWRPEDSSSDLAQGQQLLLLTRTRALAQGLWPGVAVGSQEVASQAAAQQLFLTLLEKGHAADQLQALQSLLVDVWHNGQALAAHQVSSSVKTSFNACSLHHTSCHCAGGTSSFLVLLAFFVKD